MSYLDEVVRFIEKNTAGVSLGGGGAEYSDPYTGKSSLCTYLEDSLTFYTLHKVLRDTSRLAETFRARTPAATLSPGHRDTSQLQIHQSRPTLEGAIHSLERPDTRRHSHRPILPKADIPIR
jgi:hypothetical protein